MLEEGANVNGAVDGETLLHKSARKKGPLGVKLTRLLLQAGANPTTPSRDGNSPIDIALLSGCPDSLAALMDRVNVEVLKQILSHRSTARTLYALEQAAGTVCPEVLRGMKVILECAGPHMLPPVTLSTLLQEASKSENPAAFPILLQAGAHVGMDTRSLRIAIKLQHAEAMSALIRAGTEVQSEDWDFSGCNGDRASVIDWTVNEVLEGRVETVDFLAALLEKFAVNESYKRLINECVYTTDGFNFEDAYYACKMASVHRAVQGGRRDVLEALVRKGGADLRVVDSEGRTPLFHAVERGDVDMLRCLGKLGAVWTGDDEKRWRTGSPDSQEGTRELASIIEGLRVKSGFKNLNTHN